jgi:mycothiol synthase
VEVRPARADDADGAYAVLCDAHVELYGEPQLSAGMFANMLAIGHGSVADADGQVVGAGVVNRDFGRLWVLRTERRRGIGTGLLRALERAATLGVLRFSAPAHDPAAAAFLAARGYRKASEVWLLGIDLPGEPAPPAWPDGVAVRTFDPADVRAVKRLLDEAYAAEPGYEPLPFDDWRTFMLGDPSYDPEAWFVAIAGDEIVGAALTWKEGYVKDLVVSPRWRRRGLGKALMLQTFAEFRRRGIPRVTLKTDSGNPTQAVRLYEHLGMAVEQTFEVFEKRL